MELDNDVTHLIMYIDCQFYFKYTFNITKIMNINEYWLVLF